MIAAPEFADQLLETTSPEFDAVFSTFGRNASEDAGEAERTVPPGDTGQPRVARARDYGWLVQDGDVAPIRPRLRR